MTRTASGSLQRSGQTGEAAKLRTDWSVLRLGTSARPTIQRFGRLLTLVAVVIACLFSWVASARAATGTVTSAGDSGSGSLRAVIAAAGSGDTVDFDSSLEGQTIHLTSGAIGIDKSLTIEGPGASDLTIDAGHNSQILTVTNGSLSISGLTLADGAALEEGGAIYTESTDSLTISDCMFTGNTAGGAGGSADGSNQGHGGAIFVSRSSDATSISDSTFTGNTAGGSGGTGFQSGLGSGGAIWDGSSESLAVSDSTFTGNAAGGNGDGGGQSGNGAGGAIQKSGGLSLIVSHSEFADNTAGGTGGSETYSGNGHGGAIYVSEPSPPSPPSTSLSVVDSSFSDNAAGGPGGDGESSGIGFGGAIEYYSAGTLTVSGTTFEGNSAGGIGGTGGTALFGSSGSGGGEGGAILLDESASSASVSDGEFRSNTAGGEGGGGFLSGRGDGGAIADSTGDLLTISDSAFRENAVGGDAGGGNGSGRGAGGAIKTLGGGSLTVTDSTFFANAVSAAAGGSGGAIDVFNKSLNISGSTFAANTVGEAGGGGSGGAIDAGALSSLKASVSISDSTLFGNDAGGGGASGQGGALEISDMFSATLASVTIDGNSVGPGGTGAGIEAAGGISPEGAIVTAKATIISGNTGTGATNCDAPVASSSYSLEGPISSETSCGFDLPSADPLLGPLVDSGGPTETQALPASSPAVDAVPVAKCPTKVDQRGEPRPDNGKNVCDVGAFELQDPPVAPGITSDPAATFQVGKAGSFTVTGTGLPAPDLSLTGALPGGVGFTDHGDGTAVLSGAPAAGTGGSYPVTIKAANGALPDAEQSFTLTVQAPPTASIATPVDGATYTQGQAIGANFTCVDGTGGPGIASCVGQDGRPSGTPLDTAASGPHTLTVTATSKDGLISRTSVAYMVVAPVTPKVPAPSRPRVLVSYRQEGGIGGPRPSLVVTKDRRASATFGGCTVKFALGHRIWNRLRAALKGAHLHTIAGSYPPPKGSADEITYVIKANGEVVRIAPPQPEHEEVMRDLRPLLKVLNKLVSAGKRQMPSHCKSSRS
jgi:hypothetical protein